MLEYGYQLQQLPFDQKLAADELKPENAGIRHASLSAPHNKMEPILAAMPVTTTVIMPAVIEPPGINIKCNRFTGID